MILAIDIGNTNIVVGCIDSKQTYFIERLSTVRTKTELEYAVDLKTVLDLYHIKRIDIEGCIISSVVPQIPGQLGADLVANAVAGIHEYSLPLAIIDMGTASTVSVVDEKKHYVGGMIFPGMGVSLDALTARASQLSGISIEAPKRIIGKNTIECMKSGVIYSNAAALDGIVDRIEEELGQKITVVATGGLARKIIPHCKRKILLDEDLLLKGLLIIYEKNRKEL